MQQRYTIDLGRHPQAISIDLSFIGHNKVEVEGVPLFSIMRNEKYFLPHFLSHYRSLGIKSFFIYADRCDQEFLAMLRSNDDVHVLVSTRAKFDDLISFGNSRATTRFSYFLKEMISNIVLGGKWHVFVDADEFLILPPPLQSIPDYVEALKSAGMNYCFAPMVDFYPRTLRERNFPTSLPPLLGSPYFDSGRYHRLDPFTGKIANINSGVRERILAYLARNAQSQLSALDLKISDIKRPVNYKFPLLQSSSEITRRGAHWISKVPSIENSATLAHFKYYPELDTKIASALGEGQYHNNSMQYRLLKVAIDTINDADLVFERSMKFTSSEDLIRAGVMERLATPGD
jgi:hypothetical protein